MTNLRIITITKISNYLIQKEIADYKEYIYHVCFVMSIIVFEPAFPKSEKSICILT